MTPELQSIDLALRLVVAALLGGLVGFEREFSDQPAGLRTHLLVSLGAALFTIVGAYGLGSFFDAEGDVRLDPTRIAAQVVSGIGFLGAGAILREGLNIRGLTTAAALWVAAAIGVASGFGYWEAAVVTSAVTVGALYGLKRIERTVFPRMRRDMHRFTITMEPDLDLARLASEVESHGGRVHTLKVITREDERRYLVGYMRLSTGASLEEMAAAVAAVPGVSDAEWH